MEICSEIGCPAHVNPRCWCQTHMTECHDVLCNHPAHICMAAPHFCGEHRQYEVTIEGLGTFTLRALDREAVEWISAAAGADPELFTKMLLQRGVAEEGEVIAQMTDEQASAYFETYPESLEEIAEAIVSRAWKPLTYQP